MMKEKDHPLYSKLVEENRKIDHLAGALHIIEWDQETFMPEGSSDVRAEQIKELTGIIHEKRLSPSISSPLFSLIDKKSGKILKKGIDERKKRSIELFRRDYLIEEALPASFVEDFAKLTSTSITCWKEARAKNSFSLFLPHLKKIIDASRKKADYLTFKEHPYDALLDLYEPNMTVKKTSALFSLVKEEIVPLLEKIKKAKPYDSKWLYQEYDSEKQLQLSRRLLEKLGFDFSHGRLDLSVHPFSSSSHPRDSRITTRLTNNNFYSCILTVLHEAGHSFYAMGLPESDFGSPLGQAISMGIHESQSRFFETRIGLSQSFMEFFFPEAKKVFSQIPKKKTPRDLYRAVNGVKPSFIRVEADEVTYPLHVILRFELERALIEGSLKPKDLPEAWNAGMKKLLGIVPKTDREGCLQDVHWAMGGFGYFPSYLLGNLYAAQIFSHFEKEHPNYSKRMAKGEFGFIRDFLSKNVYQWGRELDGEALMEKITSKKLQAKEYTSYLKGKYSELYSF